jgi:hypothetical protein
MLSAAESSPKKSVREARSMFSAVASRRLRFLFTPLANTKIALDEYGVRRCFAKGVS